MISLVNEVRLPVPPERVWECFRKMDDHYHEWIPEHLSWRWLRGEPLAQDTIWHADEWVGPMRINARFQVVAAEPERFVAWRILGFPAALVRASGSFRFSPAGDGGCEMTQRAHLGFSLPIVGMLLDLGMRLFLPIDEFRRHMRDEGDNLIHLIEKTTGGENVRCSN